ncbi:hypothetical protein Daus18300_001492 [Diaporthe australafricana]|uniref:Uncharacterized protein n=1 Tax=Diaporthe australafricana TaxID=127596 RepID=A0ABR3XX78_9PEZI
MSEPERSAENADEGITAGRDGDVDHESVPATSTNDHDEYNDSANQTAIECHILVDPTSSTDVDINLRGEEDDIVAAAALAAAPAPATSADEIGMAISEEVIVRHRDLVIATELGHTRTGTIGVLQFDTSHIRDIEEALHNMVCLMETALPTLNSIPIRLLAAAVKYIMTRLLIAAVTVVPGKSMQTANQ